MKKVRCGFTLVEVSLFLAITAMIFVGIAVGTQSSIFQQRYNDAVQNFAEFLRSTYSQVSNVQSEGMGRTDKAIYGRLVIFRKDGGENVINSYNVIGKIENDSASGNILDELSKLDANVIIKDGDEFKAVGFVDEYKPRWGSQIQTTAGWNSGYEIFEGMLLIVRHPGSGTIYTFADLGESIDVDTMITESNAMSVEKNYLKPLLSKDFQKEEVIFCVNPNGAEKSNLRRGVKIIAGARNASGIEILSDEEGCNS